jgi:hypothetical protein
LCSTEAQCGIAKFMRKCATPSMTLSSSLEANPW